MLHSSFPSPLPQYDPAKYTHYTPSSKPTAWDSRPPPFVPEPAEAMPPPMTNGKAQQQHRQQQQESHRSRAADAGLANPSLADSRASSNGSSFGSHPPAASAFGEGGKLAKTVRRMSRRQWKKLGMD